MSFKLSFNGIKHDLYCWVWGKSVFVPALDLGLYITVCLWPLSRVGSLHEALCMQVVSWANQKVRGHGKFLVCFFFLKKPGFDPNWVETNILLNFQQTETSTVHDVAGWNWYADGSTANSICRYPKQLQEAPEIPALGQTHWHIGVHLPQGGCQDHHCCGCDPSNCLSFSKNLSIRTLSLLPVKVLFCFTLIWLMWG